MSNKKECIKKIKHITGLALERNAIESAKRWITKANQNSIETLNPQIDKFFSLYVSYNIIYSLISNKKNGDRCSAVNVIALYMQNKNINFANSWRDIVEMIKPIQKNDQGISIFHIYSTSADNKLISNIINKKNIEESVLDLLYGIRCNMFHGKKELINEQLALLIPANKILETLVNSLIESLTKSWPAS